MSCRRDDQLTLSAIGRFDTQLLRSSSPQGGSSYHEFPGEWMTAFSVPDLV